MSNTRRITTHDAAKTLGPRKLVIGLTGVAKGGKDTTAELLEQTVGAKKFSFSDALYREVAEAFDVSEESLRDQRIKEEPSSALMMHNCRDGGFLIACLAAGVHGNNSLVIKKPNSPREILQWWGTGYRRKKDPAYWLHRSHEWLRKQPGGIYVNTSVRFENEAQWVRDEHGGEVWVVARPGFGAVNGHVAEAGIDDDFIDRVLFNDGDIDALRRRATRMAIDAIKEFIYEGETVLEDGEEDYA